MTAGSESGSGRRLLPWLVLALGALTAVAGVVLLALAVADRAEADDDLVAAEERLAEETERRDASSRAADIADDNLAGAETDLADLRTRAAGIVEQSGAVQNGVAGLAADADRLVAIQVEAVPLGISGNVVAGNALVDEANAIVTRQEETELSVLDDAGRLVVELGALARAAASID